MNASNVLVSRFKTLFVVDAIGAMFSAFMLGIVLVKFESVFGIPKSTLIILATIPCFFAVYDIACAFILKKNFALCLKIIAVANVLYCVYSLYLSYSHKEVLKILGWIYIILEILIVLVLASFEWNFAQKHAK